MTIEKNNESAVEMIEKLTGVSTGFASVNPIPFDAREVMMATDGVGTKIKLAHEYEIYSGIGQDLVAMCVNDIIAEGGVPRYFQDYIAMPELNNQIIGDIISSIHLACIKNDIILTGGETAQMEGTFSFAGNYPELVGCAVGFKMRSDTDYKTGDLIVALPSSGVHSNGFTIIRGLLGRNAYMPELLEPTKIYTEVANIYFKNPKLIKSAAHITGGGIYHNIRRIIPSGRYIIDNINSVGVPQIFDTIKNLGSISTDDMYNTFNMGVGMALIIDKNDYPELIEHLEYSPVVIGILL